MSHGGGGEAAAGGSVRVGGKRGHEQAFTASQINVPLVFTSLDVLLVTRAHWGLVTDSRNHECSSRGET